MNPIRIFPKTMIAVALMVACVGAPACNLLNPVVCTLEFRYGIIGTVTDAAGAPVPGLLITIAALDFSETAILFNGTEYVGAGEREGIYTITFEAPGFQTRTITGVEVTGDECHVMSVRQDAVLTSI